MLFVFCLKGTLSTFFEGKKLGVGVVLCRTVGGHAFIRITHLANEVHILDETLS